ncbi:hypothetical protein SDC9_90978 [bioreactor metagenome]|uniref:Uncharacterized protein n=1 Tax=bioreactor metagenome TaxID=1076179 RepID=A0A644ZTJ9_9ZZZZ
MVIIFYFVTFVTVNLNYILYNKFTAKKKLTKQIFKILKKFKVIINIYNLIEGEFYESIFSTNTHLVI